MEVSLRTLPTVMLELGHNHIDLFKMDIEGAEYGVIENLARELTYVNSWWSSITMTATPMA